MEVTEQEAFWKGQFGSEYSERNQGLEWVSSNTALFSNILCGTRDIHSILELGSNIGLNLLAIRNLLPSASLSAVEINDIAASKLESMIPDCDIQRCSLLDFEPIEAWDLVFTKGVLIHINPEKLPVVYDLMYRASSKYILISEYYNLSPVEIGYRGNSGKLFKGDFAGETLDRFPDLVLLDYGFIYHRDADFPQDDTTWFLMEKQ